MTAWRLHVIPFPANDGLHPNPHCILFAPNRLVVESGCKETREEPLKSGILSHELLLDLEEVAAREGNDAEDLVALHRTHDLLEGEMTVDHDDHCVSTADAHRFHDVAHNMEIRDRVPHISTFLAHSVHVLFHATLFVVQCVDVALLLSWGVQVTLLSTGDQYCSTPTTGSGEQRAQRTAVWTHLQCTK